MRVRMNPDERRAQLIDIGVQMLGTRPLEKVSIEALADEAGISRGLLYHYFATKNEFHRAVVKKMAADLYQVTAHTAHPDPITQLRLSLDAYVSYVAEHKDSYRALARAFAGDTPDIYRDTRAALLARLLERLFESESGITDTPAIRALAHSWSVFVEDLVLAWVENDTGLSRDALLDKLTHSLVFLLA